MTVKIQEVTHLYVIPDILISANDLTNLSYLHEPAGKPR